MMTILGGSDAHESETPEYVDKAIPRYDAFPPPGATDDFSFTFADWMYSSVIIYAAFLFSFAFFINKICSCNIQSFWESRDPQARRAFIGI